MDNIDLNGVPIGDLNRDGLDLLDDATLQSYAAHFAHHGFENESRNFRLLTQILDIYKHHDARELVDLFHRSIPFPSYPWFQSESLASYLNFSAHYFQQLTAAKEANRPNIPFFAFPKTGSSFVTSTFSTALDIPFGITSVEGRHAVPAWSKLFTSGPGVLHDHLWMNKANSAIFLTAKFERMIVHVRDPRQIIISIAHHVPESPTTAQIFGDVRVSDLKSRSPAEIIQNVIDRGQFISAYNRWLEDWLEERHKFRIMISRYEVMNEDVHKFFHDVLKFCNADQDAVATTMTYLDNQSDKERGKNFNFRAGSSDEWKDVLSDQQKDAIARQMQGTKLRELYED
ncbi:MAG: sulfotransferase domain-containing protein [Parvibaculum sp.]|nr:sulfotransferase domain-containing protein [Parvibaculum sp.]